jgi:Haem-degrading
MIDRKWHSAANPGRGASLLRQPLIREGYSPRGATDADSTVGDDKETSIQSGDARDPQARALAHFPLRFHPLQPPPKGKKMKITRTHLSLAVSLSLGLSAAATVSADEDVQWNSGSNGSFSSQCAGLPTQAQLKNALTSARNQPNGGFDLDMWGSVVNRDGLICAVAFTGTNRGQQWPGSRVISAQKANTANGFSLPTLALSTADLWAAVQPGGSLYGLQHSNPVNTEVAYKGPASSFGQLNDPMVGGRIGGVNVFGGGLALYNSRKQLIGAIGVSGDTSCADHNIAWRTRHSLILDFVPAGVSPAGDDNINYQGIVAVPSLANDFSHPICKIAGMDGVSAISAGLPPTRK